MQEYSLYDFILRPFLQEPLELNKKYRSPIKGRRDSTPSFSVKNINSRLYWRDWGYPCSGNRVEHLVQDIHGISYAAACDIIATSDFPITEVREVRVREHTIRFGELDYSEYLFWDDLNISRRILKKYKVFGLRKMYSDGRLSYDYEKDPIAFVYIGESNDLWQIYGPKVGRPHKWFQRKGTFILGYEQLPLTGQRLRLPSGMKDGLVLAELGEHFTAGSGEGDLINLRRILPEFRLRFREITSLHDPDEAGRETTRKIKWKFDINPAEFQYPNQDDIAELSKKRGLNYIKDTLGI